MSTYRIINDFDGNDFFEVEADSVEEAALVGLNRLSYYVVAPQESEEEEEEEGDAY